MRPIKGDDRLPPPPIEERQRGTSLRRKRTRRWCRGKPGTEHAWQWRDWLDFGMVCRCQQGCQAHRIVYVMEVCSTCGRHGRTRTERRPTPSTTRTQGTPATSLPCCTGSSVADMHCCYHTPNGLPSWHDSGSVASYPRGGMWVLVGYGGESPLARYPCADASTTEPWR